MWLPIKLINSVTSINEAYLSLGIPLFDDHHLEETNWAATPSWLHGDV
jgi:hypothetical protein